MNTEKLIIPGCIIFIIFIIGFCILGVAGMDSNYKDQQDLALQGCLDQAEVDYWNYMEINGTKKENGNIWALNSFWEVADERKQNTINNCFKQFK